MPFVRRGRMVRLIAGSACLSLSATLLVTVSAEATIDLRGTYNFVAHRLLPCCQDFPHTLTVTNSDPITGQIGGTGTQPNFTMSGTLVGSQITMNWIYQGGGYNADLVGTVQADRSMSGTFTDSQSQSGTWTASVASGLSWDLVRDFGANPSSNPAQDSYGDPSVWNFMQSASVAHDGNYSLLPHYSSAFAGVSGLSAWYGDVTSNTCSGFVLPEIGMNTTSSSQNPPCTPTVPAGTVFLHPANPQMVIVGWKSPTSGAVTITGGVADDDSTCGDGIRWYVDQGTTTIASGAIPNGGSARFPSALQTTVQAGVFLYFIVDPGASGDISCDTTRLDVSIATTPTMVTVLLPYQATGYKYNQVGSGQEPAGWQSEPYDDSTWLPGNAAFGSGGGCPLQPTVKTHWDTNADMLLRRSILLPAGSSGVTVSIAIDNDVHLYWNGTPIGSSVHDGCPAYNDFSYAVPNNLLSAGNNLLAVQAIDRGGESFVDVTVSVTTPALPSCGPNPNATSPDGIQVEWPQPVFSLGKIPIFYALPMAAALQPISLSLPFTDSVPQPASGYAARVDWGDGTTDTAKINFDSNGNCSISASHVYDAVGHYSVFVSMTSPDNRAIANGLVGVAAIAPAHSALTTPMVGVITGTGADGLPAQCTATVVSSLGIGGPNDGNVVVTAQHCRLTGGVAFAPGHTGISARYTQDYGGNFSNALDPHYAIGVSGGTVSAGVDSPYGGQTIGASPYGIWRSMLPPIQPDPTDTTDDIEFFVMNVPPPGLPAGVKTLEQQVGGLTLQPPSIPNTGKFNIVGYDVRWVDAPWLVFQSLGVPVAPDQTQTGKPGFAYSNYPSGDDGAHVCVNAPALNNGTGTVIEGGSPVPNLPTLAVSTCHLFTFASGSPWMNPGLSAIYATQIGTDTVNPCCVERASIVKPLDIAFLLGVQVQGVGSGSSLADQLSQVTASIAASNTTGACDQLGAFENHVSAQSGKSIPADQAAELIAAAEQIETVLSCSTP